MNKQAILTLLLALVAMAGQAKLKPKVITTLRGYPSGTIDEYHFHAGKAVVRGRFVNRAEHSFSTFNMTGTDQFSNQEFVRTINIEPDGSFLELISLPHSGWVYFDGAEIPPAFIAGQWRHWRGEQRLATVGNSVRFEGNTNAMGGNEP